jgi:hypothetical protein
MHTHDRETLGEDDFNELTTVTLAPETTEHLRILAWAEAVRKMERAIDRKTGAAWREAARAWDALAELYTPMERDRRIYTELATQCRRSA